MASVSYRLPDETQRKIRIMAATYGVSANTLVLEFLKEKVEEWEAEHGPITLID